MTIRLIPYVIFMIVLASCSEDSSPGQEPTPEIQQVHAGTYQGTMHLKRRYSTIKQVEVVPGYFEPVYESHEIDTIYQDITLTLSYVNSDSLEFAIDSYDLGSQGVLGPVIEEWPHNIHLDSPYCVGRMHDCGEWFWQGKDTLSFGSYGYYDQPTLIQNYIFDGNSITASFDYGDAYHSPEIEIDQRLFEGVKQ